MTGKKIFIRLISQISFILLKSIFTKVIKNPIFHKANIKIKIHKKLLFYHKKILMNKKFFGFSIFFDFFRKEKNKEDFSLFVVIKLFLPIVLALRVKAT